MSRPIPRCEMHEAVHDFIKKQGYGQDEARALHDEIEHPERRCGLFAELLEYLNY